MDMLHACQLRSDRQTDRQLRCLNQPAQGNPSDPSNLRVRAPVEWMETGEGGFTQLSTVSFSLAVSARPSARPPVRTSFLSLTRYVPLPSPPPSLPSSGSYLTYLFFSSSALPDARVMASGSSVCFVSLAVVGDMEEAIPFQPTTHAWKHHGGCLAGWFRSLPHPPNQQQLFAVRSCCP